MIKKKRNWISNAQSRITNDLEIELEMHNQLITIDIFQRCFIIHSFIIRAIIFWSKTENVDLARPKLWLKTIILTKFDL